MRILYYIPEITQKNGGVRQYACALLKILAQDEHNEYFILHNTQDPIVLSIINHFSNLILIPQNIGGEKRIRKIFWYTLRLTNELLVKSQVVSQIKVFSHVEQVCNRYKIDIVYCPYQFFPDTTRKTISTLHDVQELHFPEFFTPTERVERAFLHKKITEKSTLIVVSYEHIKQDLIKYFQRTDSNVMVCLLSMENLWFDKFSSDNYVSLENYSLPEQFIFYPAVTWPHKNHIALLKAIKKLNYELNLNISIVFTGHRVEYQDHIEDVIKQLNLQKQVYFLGIVTEEVLYTLYHQAKAVVVPTLYEAGSFPLMESILMQIPVICSNVTSLPETIGDEQYVFDPVNVTDIADKVYKICFDKQYRTSNLLNSHKQAVKLRNTNALAKLKEAIKEVASN